MIPIFFGWGQNSKKIADLGLKECENCHNIVGFELREVSKTAKLYFVPIAKWEKKYFIVCPICEAGYEVNEFKKNKVIQETISLPDNETSINIWNELSELVTSDFQEFSKKKDIYDYVKKELSKKGYDEDDILYVYRFFFEYFLKISKKNKNTKV